LIMSTSLKEPSALTSLAEYHQTAETAWAIANNNVHISPSPIMEAHRLEVRCLAPWDNGNQGSCRTPADFIPIVTVPGMPAKRYPEFASALIGPTVACLRLESPQMWLASNTRDLVRLVTAVVAARAGFWSAVNWVPEPSASLPAKALVYDVKRRALWLARSSGTAAHDLWLAVNSLPLMHMRYEADVVCHIGVVSPALALTGAVALTQFGPAYMVGLMIRQVDTVLRTRMPDAAYAELMMTDKFVVDGVRFGPLTGAPFAAARRWASDPLAAVSAQQRVAATPLEASDLKAQEEDLLSGISTPAVAPSCDTDDTEILSDPLMARVREHMLSRPDVPAPPEPTVLNGGMDTPRPSTPAQVPPTPTAKVVRMMTPEDADAIREIASDARRWNPPAPSELMNANPDQSVAW